MDGYGKLNGGREATLVAPAPAPAWASTALPKRLFGELLVKEGLISEFDLEIALQVQHERGGDAFLGQILVDQQAITQRELSEVLERYQQRYRLGDLLVQGNQITESQLAIALDHHRKTGLRLGDALLQLNFVTEPVLKHALCTQLGVTFVDLDKVIIDRSLAPLVGKEYAQRHRVVPVAKTEQSITVAVADPSDAALVEELQALLGTRVDIVTSTDASFQRAFTRAYGESPEAGLTRQHAELDQAYRALAREHEASLSALASLRGAQAAFLEEREAGTRLLAQQRTRNEWNTHALADLQAVHETLRREHDEALASLAELRAAHAALLGERGTADAAGSPEAEVQRERNETNERALAELRNAHDALRREAEAGARALHLLGARHADTTRALADLERAHQALQREHEETAGALRDQRDAMLARQAGVAVDLEALLRRLRA